MKKMLLLSLFTLSIIASENNKNSGFTADEWARIQKQGKLLKDPKYVAGYFEFSGLEAYKEGRLNDAEFFFEKSMAYGNPNGAYLKACLVEDKRDCPLHLNVALRWYKMAAKKGHIEAKIAVNRLSPYKTKDFTKCSCKL